jgi:hypothetical protein
MIASRMSVHASDNASNTACPPRRSFVAKRRPPPWTALQRSTANDRIAFGAVLPTPGDCIAGVDNTVEFNVIVVD